MALVNEQTGGTEAPVQQIFKAGEVVFEEGLQGKDMYLIQEGKIGVFKNTPKGRLPISVVGAGGILGEQSFFGSHVRSATAIAVESTRTVIFNQKAIQQVMASIPPWLYAMLKEIVTRLHDVQRRVDRCAVKDQERALIHIILLLLPQHGDGDGKTARIDLSALLQDAELISRLQEKEVLVIVSRLEKKGLLGIEKRGEAGGNCIVVRDLEALSLYNEYLLLKSRGARFDEAHITKEAVATLSNIAYVAQKSGQETVEGTALYKSALVEDLSDQNNTAILEKNLAELAQSGLIIILPVEEETLILFKKERLIRIKKIKEWLPKFELETEAA
jgi:CRP-like cAMP-binding protein